MNRIILLVLITTLWLGTPGLAEKPKPKPKSNAAAPWMAMLEDLRGLIQLYMELLKRASGGSIGDLDKLGPNERLDCGDPKAENTPAPLPKEEPTPSTSPAPTPKSTESPTPSASVSPTPSSSPVATKPPGPTGGSSRGSSGDHSGGASGHSNRKAQSVPVPDLQRGDPARSDYSGQNGIDSFRYSSDKGGACQATFVTSDILVSAAHCFSAVEPGQSAAVEMVSNQFGKDEKDYAKARGTVYISPNYDKDQSKTRHDFAIVKLNKEDLNQPMAKRAKVLPLCQDGDVKAGAAAKVASHRTGKNYDAVIETEEKDGNGAVKNWEIGWKALGAPDNGIGVRIQTDSGGAVGGDSGGALVVNGRLCGVLSLLFGGSGTMTGQFTGYGAVNKWVRDTIAKLSSSSSSYVRAPLATSGFEAAYRAPASYSARRGH